MPSKPYIPSSTDSRKLALDLSVFEEDVKLDVVVAYRPKVEVGIFRIGGSASVKDAMFPVFWPWAKQLGLKHDIYMYTWPGWTVSQHISNFMSLVNTYCADGDLGTGPIWVDIECDAGKTKKEVSDMNYQVIKALQRETGKEIGVYTAQWFVEGYMEKQDWMREVLLWWAQWVYEQGREHPGPIYIPPGTFDRAKALWHQTGSMCKTSEFGGVDYCDTDRWIGTEEQWKQHYGDDIVPPPPSNLEKRIEIVENDLAIVQDKLIQIKQIL